MERLTETNIGTLIDQLSDLRSQNLALKRRVQFLEERLAERIELTEQKYAERKGHFAEMQNLVYKIFLANPTRELSYADIIEEWHRLYPNLASAAVNAPRRTRELEVAGRLWHNTRKSDGLVVYWLKLDAQSLEP